MATQENKCRLCTGTGDLVLYRYSPSDYQIDADCVYGSLEECEVDNNPRESYINPAQCLVWFNDNGEEVLGEDGNYIFQNYYGQTNQENPIPSVSNQTISPSAVANIGDVQSRLWAYDLTGNTLYYVDSFTHEGSDIGITTNKLFVGCQHKFQGHTKNAAIVSYGFTMTGNDTTTFQKAPLKTYRFVNEDGYLIREGAGTNHYGTTSVGLGDALGTISDTEILIDDDQGNVYYADLTNFWSGSSVYADVSVDEEPTYTWVASNNIDSNGDPYLNLNSTDIVSVGVETEAVDGWRLCAHATQGRIYTVVVKKILQVNDTNYHHYKLQGDIKFNPSDPILSGDPSFIVTYEDTSSDATIGGCLQNPGAVPVKGTGCAKMITKFKFPTDLDNITIQTYDDRFTREASANDEEFTPDTGAGNIVEDGVSGILYGFSENYRWAINPTTLTYSNPIKGEFRLFNKSGLGLMVNWDYNAGKTNQMLFRGGAQSPECVTTSAYTYNCTTNGCDSVLGAGGVYSSFSACSADCVSYSCSTMCECISGVTADIGGVGYFGPYVLGGPMGLGHLAEYRYVENNNVSIQSTTMGDTCIWPLEVQTIPNVAYPYTWDNMYGHGIGWNTSNVQPGETQVMGVHNSGNQQSSWGIDGTRFCLDDDCTTYVDQQGPASGVGSGFWGATGNYVLNARLNTIGVFPNNIDSHNMEVWGSLNVLNSLSNPGSAQYDANNGPFYRGYGGAGWNGMSRCVTVTGTTSKVYFIGVGSSEYYRIGIDGVIQVDTSTPQLANRGFNPNSQPNPSSNQDVVDGTGTGNESRLWWMHKFELLPGEHSITVEMFAMASQAIGGLAVPNAFQYKAFGMDIIGPFDVGVYDTSADITTNFTPQIYTANTILSTSEIAEPTQLPTSCNANACFLSGCYYLHHVQEPIPVTMMGSLVTEYPDPYRVAAGLGGTWGWENPGLDPILLPNGGEYKPSGGLAPGIPAFSMRELPYYAPKTNGVHVVHPGTSTYTRQLLLGSQGYVMEDPALTPWAANYTLGTLSITSNHFGGGGPFIPTNPNASNQDPCESPIPSHWGPGATYQRTPAPVRIYNGNTMVDSFMYQSWEEIIDWLNGEGLYVSSVADPRNY